MKVVENVDLDKLTILGGAAKFDICASTSSGAVKVKNSQLGSPTASGICHSFTPDGRCVSLLKVLMTNECQKDCGYCANRVQRDVRRVSFTPEELSRIFIELYKRNFVEGLFLSSGIRHNTQESMSRLLDTAEILRTRYRFGGYIHLKILPGSTPDLICQAAKLANRLSLNLEAPSATHLRVISSTKNYETELLNPLRDISRAVTANRGVSQTTQFVVGASRESDLEILTSVSALYKKFSVKRTYYSAFEPLPGTPLENQPPTPLLREHRLYQADFLLRQYNFTLEELFSGQENNLDLTLDPKLMFAVKSPQLFPVEINKGSLQQLLRVPGIGPKSARRIIVLRRRYRFTLLEELKNIGVVIKRAAPFITINGQKQDPLKWLLKPEPIRFKQLSFW